VYGPSTVALSGPGATLQDEKEQLFRKLRDIVSRLHNDTIMEFHGLRTIEENI
jgi:hypothetical protein